jgi:hypothetical protein
LTNPHIPIKETTWKDANLKRFIKSPSNPAEEHEDQSENSQYGEHEPKLLVLEPSPSILGFCPDRSIVDSKTKKLDYTMGKKRKLS